MPAWRSCLFDEAVLAQPRLQFLLVRLCDHHPPVDTARAGALFERGRLFEGDDLGAEANAFLVREYRKGYGIKA